MTGFSDIVLGGGVPSWLAAVLALAAAGFLVHQFRFLHRSLGPRKASLLTLLRGLVYALLLLFLLGPTRTVEEDTALRRPLVVLLDTSESMGLSSGRDEASRLDAAREVLAAPGLTLGLAQKYDLKLYGFDRETTPRDFERLAGAAPAGDASRLFEALESVNENEPDAAGVIVVSDGIVNPTEALDAFSGHPKPVFAVGVGQAEGFKDLRIAGLRAPELAFRGRAITIDFTIQAYGMAGVQVPLYFNLGRNLISTHPITIDRDAYENRVTLNYTPRELGAHGFTLTLPEQGGESIAGNNRKAFRMEVRRDKIRVLTLSGSPSWNYRFLRFALKQDPFLELVSFVFLRTPNDVVDVRENELSLIPFPIDEIFVEELKNFDVLILDDFSHRTYFNPVYFENMRDFVRDGGGVAMLGGARAFDRGGYHETALNPVLPVKLDGRGDFQTGIAARAGLTPAGKAHPLTRVFADPAANEEAWAGLPPLTTLNGVAQAKGEVLLSAEVRGRRAPLLSVGRYHKGRSLAFASDDLWRWNFDAVGRDQNPQIHLKLIRNGVRWLAQEPAFEQVQILAVGGSRRPGEKLEFRIRVLQDDHAPARDPALQVVVTGPEGERSPLEAAATEQAGEYRSEFTPRLEGSHRIEVQATSAGNPLGNAAANFLVALPSEENDDGRPRPELLQAVAARSQGMFATAGSLTNAHWSEFQQRMEQAAPSSIVARSRVALWNEPLLFTLVVLLLAAEWWLRRTWGLV